MENIRAIALEILMEALEDGTPGHVPLSAALTKYQFLPKRDRAFLTRLVEGTMEYQIQLDYCIDQVSRVEVSKMKPVIREILRMSAYQIFFMDAVPSSAAVNEAVSLTQKKGFYNLKPFVNGVLRSLDRGKDSIAFPKEEEDLARYLSVAYSCPPYLVEKWLPLYGREKVEKILGAFLKPSPTYVRVRGGVEAVEEVTQSLIGQGVDVRPAPYLPYALELRGYDHLYTLEAFLNGEITVQDVSSQLVGQVCAPKKGDYCLDLCAAPGGKSLHLADLMQSYGCVDARDLTEAKVALIEENLERMRQINVQTKVWDATVFDLDMELSADIVLADVPCSGFGVIGRKPDIKCHVGPGRVEELVPLQRQILDNAALYVKSRGVLVYSTCTICQEENEENVRWFLENHPFALESLDPYLPEELHCPASQEGYLQLLPGVHRCDGFFLARFRRKT